MTLPVAADESHLIATDKTPSARADRFLAAVSVDVLQFHGSEPAALCRAFGRRYVKAISVKDGVDLLESVSPYDDAAALLFDAAASHGWFAGARLYDAQHFWMDVRFYLGWTLGLVLAPSPADTDHPL